MVVTSSTSASAEISSSPESFPVELLLRLPVGLREVALGPLERLARNVVEEGLPLIVILLDRLVAFRLVYDVAFFDFRMVLFVRFAVATFQVGFLQRSKRFTLE